MRLSIVTINYNNAEGLRKTLASVASQTYRDIEHVIIDGASTDDSVRIIKEYVQRVNSEERRVNSGRTVIWSSEPDRGIYDAMNKGIKRATGDYVWILNSGDWAANDDVVQRMVDTLQELGNERVGELEKMVPILIGNKIHVYSEDENDYKPIKSVDKPNVAPIWTSMLTFYDGTIPQDAAFVRRDLYEKYGYFDETMKICADWKLYLNMIALGGVVPMYVDIDVVLFDMSGVSNVNHERRLAERREYIEQVLPKSILRDYDAYATPIRQYERLKRYHMWGVVHLLERILFKMEKWGVLRK